MVLGADGQRILQEPEGQVILHNPMEHQANVVLHKEVKQTFRKQIQTMHSLLPKYQGHTGISLLRRL